MKLRQLISLTILALAFVFASFSALAGDGSSERFNGWQNVGPLGGDIRAIAIDPRDKKKLYITTLDSQVYASPDAGKTWRLLTTFSRAQVVLDDILVDFENSNFLYVSGHRGNAPGGLIYSRDAGQTWTEAKDLQNEAIHCLAQSSKNPNTFLACAPGKVFISYNRGENWKRITDDSIGFNVNIPDSAAFDPRDENVMYVGTTHRPYKSIDGGKTWKLISKGMIDDSDVFSIKIDQQNPDHIIMSACSGIYETSNGGELFTKIQGIPSESRRTRAIVVNPARNGGVYAGTSNGFWMSADDGKSWALTTQRELEVNAIAIHPDEPNKIYVGTNNYGLMVSTDGGKSFNIQNGNFSSRFTQKIIADVEKTSRFYAITNNTGTGGGFIFVTDDGGQNWTPAVKNLSVIRNQTFSLLQDKQNPNTIYIGTNMGVFRSVDRGASWAPVGAAAPVKGTTPAKKPVAKGKTAKPAVATTPKKVPLKGPVRGLAWTNDGKGGILAATDAGLYRSYNVALGWDKITLSPGISEQLSVINAPSGQPGTIWAGTVRSGVVVSNDDGATWKTIVAIPTAVIGSIEIDPRNPNNVYIGTSQTLYISKDGGATFFRRGGNLLLGSFNSILINPSNPNEVFAASSTEGKGGVFHSPDGGQTWRQLDGKDLTLPSRRIWTMAFDSKNPNRILLGTHSSGIYSIERTTSATTDGTRPRVASNQKD